MEQPVNEPLLSSSLKDDNNPNQSTKFKVCRIFVFSLICLSDLVVYFHRACPNVVGSDMAKSYGVDESKLGVLSSMFYYTYALLQPFSGMLADVVEPAFLISGSGILAAFGSVLCGFSKSLFVGCIGRLIVGIGSAPVYSPSCRVMMNWFELKDFPKMTGIYCLIAGCGALLAQSPLALLAEAIGWRMCFHATAILGVLIASLVFFFVRGNPVAMGFKPVNQSLAFNMASLGLGDKFRRLWYNFKIVFMCPSFWCVSVYLFFSNGVFYDLNGSWGCEYLIKVYGYSKVKASNILLALSITNSVASVIIPFITEFTKSKKWTMVGGTFIAMLSCLPFIFLDKYLSVWSIVLLYSIFSFTTTSFASIAYPMLTEYFDPNAGASACGSTNCFAFISSVVLMPLTGSIMKSFGEDDYRTGFKYGIWVLSLGCLFISNVAMMLAKDPRGSSYKIEHDPNSMSTISTLSTYNSIQ